MFKKSLIPLVIATALVGCGSDDSGKLEGNNTGSIEIVGSDFIAGATLTTTLSDADGIVADMLVIYGQQVQPVLLILLPKRTKVQS